VLSAKVMAMRLAVDIANNPLLLKQYKLPPKAIKALRDLYLELPAELRQRIDICESMDAIELLLSKEELKTVESLLNGITGLYYEEGAQDANRLAMGAIAGTAGLVAYSAIEISVGVIAVGGIAAATSAGSVIAGVVGFGMILAGLIRWGDR
jgi:hypothetical protein